jgi:Ankyrin repeats (many copies)
MVKPDLPLWEFVAAIVAGDARKVSRLIAPSPALASACFQSGATRQTAKAYFLEPIERYVFAGDTALHIAAAAYRTEIARKLISAGANVHARNRFGDEALHAAAVGRPGSRTWNPPAQAATIICLIESGADPNALDKLGVSPLHRAVRTRCATAVRTLLEYGADPRTPEQEWFHANASCDPEHWPGRHRFARGQVAATGDIAAVGTAD